ncbi:MAG: prolyl oligopeptidase family serine peptidase [bacterium]
MMRNTRFHSAAFTCLSLILVYYSLSASDLSDHAPPAANAAPASRRSQKREQHAGGTVLNEHVNAHWLEGRPVFWYQRQTGTNRTEFVRVDAATATKRPAFDHARLAAAWQAALGKPVDPGMLPITSLRFSEDDRTLLFDAASEGWECSLDTYAVKRGTPGNPPPAPPQPSDQNRSPDGRWLAVIKDHNLWLKPTGDGEPAALSTDGTGDDPYGLPVFWAPDSSRVVALKTRAGERHIVTLVESSPSDQVQPKVHTFDYLKPGDRIPQPRPRLFDVAGHQPIAVAEELFSNPWSIDAVRWEPDSRFFTFAYNERGHQVLRVVAVDRSSVPRTVVEERSATFVDYSGKYYCHFRDNTHELLWMSERDGWNHLYRYDTATNQACAAITKGPWVVRDVEHVDDAAGVIWFALSGLNPGEDPYYIHHARVNIDGSGMTVLTAGNGTHEAAWSPDRRYLIDTWSRVDQPPVSVLRDGESGRELLALERADAAALFVTGWKPPEPFIAKGRDSTTDICGVIWKPAAFSPDKRYPVIENIYAGPQGAYVPKAFTSSYSSQRMADLGFIVVMIDGMGTSYRSKAFHDVCWKNLGDAGFPDRIAWLRAAAAARPWMDLTRVGIYGGSAGGQNALRGLLMYPDFYKVGVADCGCHDNRMDKIWWNELWMGWPVGPHYAEQSNVTQAHRLQGKLMLIVGELDNNVDPSSTLQVANALVKADKDFDLVLIPGSNHGAGETPYGSRRRADFFVRHLLGDAAGVRLNP